MRATHSPDLLRRSVRARICNHCSRCTPGYENCSSDIARPCEGTCAIFRSLPILQHVAEQMDPMLCVPEQSLEKAIRDIIRYVGDAGGEIDWTPLQRERRDLIRILQQTACH